MELELKNQFSVALLTLGCAKNEADSREMKQLLEEQAFIVTEDPAQVDFILLNTCAFIEAAVEESLDAVLELASLDNVREGKTRIVVAGCLPSRFGEDLREELPEVDTFVPVDREKGVAQTLRELIENEQLEPAEFQGFDEGTARPEPLEADLYDLAANQDSIVSQQKTSETKEPWDYVKISDGCSRFCSYCTIPYIRGAYHSFSYQSIKAEVDELVKSGAREIILIGQDTGIWSSSEPNSPHNLAELLSALAEAYPQTWFRVMYLQPEGISDELLEVIARYKNIAKYLDIPLQHANQEILESMNRRGSGAEYLRLLRHIRSRVPGVVLRTTVIAGYPGESRKDANELKAFLDAAQFDYVGIFPYSREDGTVAAGLSHQIKKKTALVRVQALRDLADGIGFAKAEQCVGREVDLLICGSDEEGVYGRTQGQAPEVDGITYLHLTDTLKDLQSVDVFSSSSVPQKENQAESAQLQPGMVIRARITESVLYDLYAEVL